MNTYPNSIQSFYLDLSKDVSSLFSEYDLTESWDWLFSQSYHTSWHTIVENLCLLGKEFERCLITPRLMVVPTFFPVNNLEGSLLPCFLEPLFDILFHKSGLRRYDAESVLVTKEASAAVLAIRQVTLAFSKAVDIPPKAREIDEYQLFKNRVTQVPDLHIEPVILTLARKLIRSFFYEAGSVAGNIAAPFAQWVDNPFGRHGPGAVAGEEKGYGKWNFNPCDLDERLFEIGLHEPVVVYYEEPAPAGDYSIVTLVPKDFRGRRVICIEPKEHMFAQQGLMQVIYSYTSTHPLTKYAIDFRHQEKSQRRAADNRMATIDLSNASDMVSKTLCRRIFPREVFSLLSRYRTPKLFINHPIDEDSDVAPHIFTYESMFTMGNALCFPTETLVFWALALATMIREASPYEYTRALQFIDGEGPWSPKEFWKMFPVTVFGDDIIVPKRNYDSVLQTLKEAGFVVNVEKSCANTLVRESCGAWLYNNDDVRITRFAYHQLKDTSVWLSWAANAQELLNNGFTTAAQGLIQLLVSRHPASAGYLGLPTKMTRINGYRYNKDLQRVEVCMPSDREVTGAVRLSGPVGLYAYFTGQSTYTVRQRVSQRNIWRWVDIHTRLG